MKTTKLEQDIPLYCLSAKSFPEGIQDAHQTLYRKLNFSPDRKYYGLSWMDMNGNIIYKAAAAELNPGELSKTMFERFTLRRGDYVYIDVRDFRQNIAAIGQAFDRLKTEKRMDPNGVAVEFYFNDTDVRCMIRIINS